MNAASPPLSVACAFILNPSPANTMERFVPAKGCMMTVPPPVSLGPFNVYLVLLIVEDEPTKRLEDVHGVVHPRKFTTQMRGMMIYVGDGASTTRTGVASIVAISAGSILTVCE